MKTALFTEQDIVQMHDHLPIAMCENKERMFSTGNLERAMNAGYNVWVIMTRNTDPVHDAWWMQLVAKDQILTPQNGEQDDDPLACWNHLFTRLNIPWNSEFTSVKNIQRTLRSYGIACGDDFTTYDICTVIRAALTHALNGVVSQDDLRNAAIVYSRQHDGLLRVHAIDTKGTAFKVVSWVRIDDARNETCERSVAIGLGQLRVGKKNLPLANQSNIPDAMAAFHRVLVTWKDLWALHPVI